MYVLDILKYFNLSEKKNQMFKEAYISLNKECNLLNTMKK